MNPRDLPEVGAELGSKMHEVRSEPSALNGRTNRLARIVEIGFREELGNETRQHTDYLIEAFGRSLKPLINPVLNHDTRLEHPENPQ